MKSYDVLAYALLVALTLSSGIARGEADEVRLYTNADLERLGPAPADPSEPIPQEKLGWEFVLESIARERARLDAERELALDRRALELVPEADEPDYVLPYYGYPLGHYTSKQVGHHRPPRHLRGHDPSLPGAHRPSRIVPLHARPTQAQVQRAKAMRLSGADAVPR